MIQILKSCLHIQLIRIIGVHLNFGNTVIIVSNPTTLVQIVFANNTKVKKENRKLNLDRNHL